MVTKKLRRKENNPNDQHTVKTILELAAQNFYITQINHYHKLSCEYLYNASRKLNYIDVSHDIIT